MVDVGGKQETQRIAIARGTIRMLPATFALIRDGKAKKGDVLGVARIAAIQGAKRTADLIPLCHPLALTRVAVEFELDDALPGVHCVVQVETFGRTGVEMEALTAVQVGLLTVYDMCKAVDRGMVITDVSVREKRGGKSGTGRRRNRRVERQRQQQPFTGASSAVAMPRSNDKNQKDTSQVKNLTLKYGAPLLCALCYLPPRRPPAPARR